MHRWRFRDPSLRRFDSAIACDRRTDGQPDRTNAELCIASYADAMWKHFTLHYRNIGSKMGKNAKVASSHILTTVLQLLSLLPHLLQRCISAGAWSTGAMRLLMPIFTPFQNFRYVAGFLLRRATPHLFHPNFGGCSPWTRLPMLWLRGAKTLS